MNENVGWVTALKQGGTFADSGDEKIFQGSLTYAISTNTVCTFSTILCVIGEFHISWVVFTNRKIYVMWEPSVLLLPISFIITNDALLVWTVLALGLSLYQTSSETTNGNHGIEQFLCKPWHITIFFRRPTLLLLHHIIIFWTLRICPYSIFTCTFTLFQVGKLHQPHCNSHFIRKCSTGP